MFDKLELTGGKEEVKALGEQIATGELVDKILVTCYFKHMQTLSRRTNVLFTPDEHGMLIALSRESKKTMGELIRHAVRKVYAKKTKKSFEESLERIRKLTKDIKIKKSEYRSFVADGRKYDN